MASDRSPVALSAEGYSPPAWPETWHSKQVIAGRVSILPSHFLGRCCLVFLQFYGINRIGQLRAHVTDERGRMQTLAVNERIIVLFLRINECSDSSLRWGVWWGGRDELEITGQGRGRLSEML